MYRIAGLFTAFVMLAGASLSPAAAEDKTITVFAAASMKNALDEIDAAYAAKTGVKITASYAASSVLAKQIEQGAPADVFVSADTDWMDYAASKKTINEPSRVNLLGNSIVLIAPKDSKIDNVTIAQGFDLAKLAGDGKIATGDVKSVPVGKYAKAALEKLGAWQAAEPKFAMAESVRAALTLVARGEANLGIVYSTDAKVEPGVKIVGTFPADSHPAIIYPVAATTTAKPETNDYLAFLKTSAAKTILEKYGFKFLISPDDLISSIDARHLSRRMDGDPALAQGRRHRDAGRNAVRHCAGVAARPQGFLGQVGARRRRASAAGAAAGRHRLSPASHLRPPRSCRRLPRRHLGIVFAFRWTGAALACGMMSFPLLVRPMRLSIEAIDRRLEQAAETLGAAPWKVFFTVTLPLALPGVLAGMVLGFAKAIGEFGATITFVSNIPGETQTISSAIYSLIQTPDGDRAAGRLVIVSIVLAIGALIAAEWFARRATQRLHGN